MKTVKLPKELVLDYKTWVCGDGAQGDKSTSHGKGTSALLNKEGCMCCLGQFSFQAGVAKKDLLGYADGTSLVLSVTAIHIPTLSRKDGQETKFSNDAIEINDTGYTSIASKAKALKKLCSKHKRKLTFKNFPKRILEEINGY